MENLTWMYNGESFTETPTEYTGFVYHITFPNGLKYIGRKIFWSARKKIVKGKTKRLKVESDWKRYYGSSDYIKTLLTNGDDGVIREIIRLCKSKSEMAYFESKKIFETDALLRPDYINRWITCQINGKNLEYLNNGTGADSDKVSRLLNDGSYRESIESIVSDV